MASPTGASAASRPPRHPGDALASQAVSRRQDAVVLNEPSAPASTGTLAKTGVPTKKRGHRRHLQAGKQLPETRQNTRLLFRLSRRAANTKGERKAIPPGSTQNFPSGIRPDSPASHFSPNETAYLFTFVDAAPTLTPRIPSRQEITLPQALLARLSPEQNNLPNSQRVHDESHRGSATTKSTKMSSHGNNDRDGKCVQACRVVQILGLSDGQELFCQFRVFRCFRGPLLGFE